MWTGEGADRRYVPEYRVETVGGEFEPQMKYQVNGTEQWYALLENGCLADPDIWKIGSNGESFVRVILPTTERAERAVLRAKVINGQNDLLVISSHNGGER